MERRLSAILAADVVAFAAHMQRDETGTYERLVAVRQTLFEPGIERHHGRIFKLMGDGLLAEFSSVVDAIECAALLQRELARRNASLPEPERIQLRIGVNLGEVIIEGLDRYGEGVNVAARLQQLADPGGICVSAKVTHEVEGKLSFAFELMGEKRVKKTDEPIIVYRVLLDSARRRKVLPALLARSSARHRTMGGLLAAASLIVAGVLAWSQSQYEPSLALPLPDGPSIAVLPFDNLTGDQAWDRLADGMTEDVTTNLSLSRDLFVIARNSTLAYKDKTVDTRQVGRDLGVQYIVEGTIQRSADGARISTQLIEAATGRQVKSLRYDRPLQDIFAVQDEVTQAISGTLLGYEGAIAQSQRDAVRRKPPASLRAYDYYLLGIEAKHKETQEDNIKAQQLFRKALESDPEFARAYIGLAWTHCYEITLGYTNSPERSISDWLAAANKAVALDPSDGEAYMVRGEAYVFLGDYKRAAPDLDRGLELNPNSADLLVIYALATPPLGYPKKGVEAVERAIRINPNYPAWYISIMRNVYYFDSQFDKALTAARRLQNPVAVDYALLAAIYAQLGLSEEAEKTSAKVLEMDPEWSAERYINDRGSFSRQAEEDVYVEGIRKAGLPLCASEGYVKKNPKLKRLAACQQV